jgi:hypothetical protein
VRGPGLKAGSTFSQLATNVDLSPTMMALAGISADVIAQVSLHLSLPLHLSLLFITTPVFSFLPVPPCQASDGHSMLPLLMAEDWHEDIHLPNSVRRAMSAVEEANTAASIAASNVGSTDSETSAVSAMKTKANWRSSIFHEVRGHSEMDTLLHSRMEHSLRPSALPASSHSTPFHPTPPSIPHPLFFQSPCALVLHPCPFNGPCPPPRSPVLLYRYRSGLWRGAAY